MFAAEFKEKVLQAFDNLCLNNPARRPEAFFRRLEEKMEVENFPPLPNVVHSLKEV